MTTSLVKIKGTDIQYAMDVRLKHNLDTKVIPDLHKKDKDCIFVVDGAEGSGKSTLAFQIGMVVDPTLDLSRVVFSPDDFRDAILKAKKGQCIIYDEAFTGFSSRNSLSPVNRVLVSLAMQMRQKNLFILIVLPTIFLLDKYMAIFRTKALIHVYENKGIRGYFRIFNRKKKQQLILRGQKTMQYNHKGLYTRFKGRFYGKFALGGKKVEKKYREMKEKALADSEKTSMSSAQVRFKEQRDLLIWLFKNYTKMTYRELAEALVEYGFNMSFQQIGRICSKFGEILSEKDKKDIEDAENEKKVEDNDTKPIGIEENVDKSDIKEEETIDLDEKTLDLDEKALENDDLD